MHKRVVLITGANGMLAKKLSEHLEQQYEIRFLTRKVTASNEYLWDVSRDYIDPKALKGVNHIIHLAGASIADSRWTEDRKKVILASRVDTAQLLLNELKMQGITISSFISASAVGYYGTNTTSEIFDEESPVGNDFLAKVCQQWEGVASDFEKQNIAKRVVILRLGIILSSEGGALDKMVKPVKYYIGSALGSGRQIIPWIHIDDLVRMFSFALNNTSLNGIFNAVAPQVVDNKFFTKAIATQIKKPLILPNIPSFVFRLLFGEMAVILLEGSPVSSQKIINLGFAFRYENIKSALKHLLK